MKLTLRIAASILVIVGIIMIIVGATAFNIQNTFYIGIGVFLLAFGVSGFIAVSAIGQDIELDKNNDTHKTHYDEEK